MPLLTVRAIDTQKPKAEPYKLTLDRGLQLRVAPDGAHSSKRSGNFQLKCYIRTDIFHA